MELSQAAIEANIEHYEALVQNAHNEWEQHLQNLQYWMDQLERAQNAVTD